MPMLLFATGLFVTAGLEHHWPAVVLGLVIAGAGLNAHLPAFWALPPQFLTGEAAAGSVGLINSVGNLGGFLGPTLVGALKEGRAGYGLGLGVLGGFALLAAATIAVAGALAKARPFVQSPSPLLRTVADQQPAQKGSGRPATAGTCRPARLYTAPGRWQAARPSGRPEDEPARDQDMNKIFLSSDHAGFSLRSRVARHLAEQHLTVDDCGPPDASPVDYPDEASKVCRLVRDTPEGRGILICGSGVGMSIAANKVHGIRAVDAWNLEVARLSRQHNDANVLCLGARVLSEEQALEIIDLWLATAFEGGRHATRVGKIAALEAAEAGT